MDALRTRLAEVLAAYGADPRRWPESERRGLEALVEAEPELFAEASEVDHVLARARIPQVPHGAAARLITRLGHEKPPTQVIRFERAKVRPSGWSWGAAVALAASFAVGIFLGTTNFLTFSGDNDVVEIDDPIVLTGIDDASDLYGDDG